MGLDEQFELQTLDRFINILQSGYKNDKKRALQEMKTVVDHAEGKTLIEIHDKIQNQLILSFQDPMEFVREGALTMSQTMIEKLDVDVGHISLLIPALYPRVCREKDPEGSEELRLIIANLLIVIVEKYDKFMAPYLTEAVDMICRLLKDPAPDIKQATSKLAISLVKRMPAETFQFTKKLWPPMVKNLEHQRWRVRVASVQALETVMLYGDNKCVPDVTPSLNKKMLDSMYQVRLALVKLAGHWLVKLPDRYSFFAHLIPIILSGLADDNSSVSEEAARLWEAAGDTYLKENEHDLKDKINYEAEILDHYPFGVKRPSLGCRVLIEREASKFLLALVNELTDWVEMVRIKSSLLLTQVVLHYEYSITMAIRKIIAQICKAARDKETPLVAANVKLAAEYMGYFVPADTYCALIIEYMKEAHEGELLVVAGLIRGTKRADLVDNLNKVSTLLDHTTFKGHEQLALLDLIESILTISQSDSFHIGSQLLAALVSTAGLAEGDFIRSKAEELIEKFVEFGGGDKRTVFTKHCDTLFDRLSNAVWTVHCHEQFIFASLVNLIGHVVSERLESVLEVLRGALNPDNDAEVLLKIMMATNNILDNREVSLPTDESLAKFVKVTLTELLPPHLKWSAGRSAEAMRTTACTILFMCLSKVAKIPAAPQSVKPRELRKTKIKVVEVSQEQTSSSCQAHSVADDDQVPEVDFSSSPETIYGLPGYLEPLLPLILSLAQDPAPKTRLLSLNCLKTFAEVDAAHQAHFSSIVSSVIKRLDDADKSVRAASVEVIKTFYTHHPNYSEHVNTTLLDFVYSTLLIHLDDQDSNLKNAILCCLIVAGELNPSSLRSKVFPDNFRDKKVCDALIEHLDDKLKVLQVQ